MLDAIHILLTLDCTGECDHCFLYCKPGAGGTFTLQQVKTVLDECRKLGAIDWIYYEGGEPLLYYPLLLESVRMAHGGGFQTGVVTNCYWATSEPDAELWLRPLHDAGLTSLSVSNDYLHNDDPAASPSPNALQVARRLGIDADEICIKKPNPDNGASSGDVMFRGRAADKLTVGMPLRRPEEFTVCDREELTDPKRVHVDAFGNVHICQGISMGNMWRVPLTRMVKDYRPAEHPVIGPLLKGGPLELAKRFHVKLSDGYVDACHLCFDTRRALLDRLPEWLTPKQVYGSA